MSEQGNTSETEASHGHVSGQSNTPMSAPAHALSSQEVVKELHADTATGLSAQEAASRLATAGHNELDKKKGVQPIKIFVEQIFNAMTLVTMNSTMDGSVYNSLTCLIGAAACSWCKFWHPSLD